ncbi:MAG: PBSX family phage terminase large subunit [Acutalibacteraceae bacterium]
MRFTAFSAKQKRVLTWWCSEKYSKKYDAVICDGAVRSGKTLCMSLSFISWAMYRFNGMNFAICGKTITGVRRNVVTPVVGILKDLGFEVEEKISAHYLDICANHHRCRFYLFGGRDESSAALIQGMTLAGVMFDEAALMPRSFIEQALARCSVEGAKFWFNCNPEYPQHWFHTEWISKTRQKKALYIHFTMEDNPSLSPETLERYRHLYSGAFYERFVLGKWVAADGAVYPFMSDEKMFCAVPSGDFEDYAVSCDYGTVNPASFGLWGKQNGVWYRLREYYYDSRAEGSQKTDEEHYNGLENLVGTVKVSAVTVDPSAASFMEVIRRHGRFHVVPAQNNVLDGIRKTSTMLKEGKIRICRTCKDSMREFGLYRWEGSGSDRPVKENDHAMDDIRYFVSTLAQCEEQPFMAVSVQR